MRRVALLLVLGLVLVGTTGCYMNLADPLHPRPCPTIPTCCDFDRCCPPVYRGPCAVRPVPSPVYMGCSDCPCERYP